MNQNTSRTAKRWHSIGKSIFSEMTNLSKIHGAINLGQGFPDFKGPQNLLDAISNQVLTCHSQYAPMPGEAALCKQVANFVELTTSVSYHPETEVTITTGASEAIYCAINAFVNPNSRVLVFEPVFDLYYQAIANAGGEIIPVRLHAPDTPVGVRQEGWAIDWSEFDAATAQGFSLVIFNSPHNPTGKVFTEEEMERISAKILKNDAIVLCDEVYENLVYDNARHVSLSSFPKLKHSVVRISSAAKTFGFTGLKTGWICASKELTEAIRIVHQATVFCVSPYTQLGLAEVMADTNWLVTYLNQQRKDYLQKRNILESFLKKAGFEVAQTQGTFFITASFEKLVPRENISSLLFARQLVESHKVATIPLCSFYKEPPKNLPWLRFAFCKTLETLQSAGSLLLSKPFT